MKHHYGRSVAGLAIMFVLLVLSAWLANSIAADAKEQHRQLAENAAHSLAKAQSERTNLERLRQVMGPVKEFGAAWASTPQLCDKDAAEQIRSEIENIAQRQLGLVTDNAITPQSEKFSSQGSVLRVQRVTLRASGKDLASLLTWVGKVEEKYPAALVETCELSSNVGGSTGVTLRLAQPISDSPKRAPIPASATFDSAQASASIATVDWSRYLPARVKAPIAIALARNPLQPAVIADAKVLPIFHDQGDDVAPKVEAVLDRTIRSVVRGGAPLVVVDGRVFRIGDEVIIGRRREKIVPEAKTRLKHIADDHLVFQVSGGSADHPIQCEVRYALPSFLCAR